jgi:hypothetical protein
MKKYRSLFEDKKERPQLEEFIDVFMTKFPSMFVRGLGIVLEVDDCSVSKPPDEAEAAGLAPYGILVT